MRKHGKTWENMGKYEKTWEKRNFEKKKVLNKKT